MDQLVTVRTQLWVKLLIILGFPLLGISGIYVIWESIQSGFNPPVKNLILFGAGVFCILAVLKGMPLLRFFNQSLVLCTDGIEIKFNEMAKRYRWDEIGAIKGSDTFNILRIYDTSGKLIYAVDYSAKNYRNFILKLHELLHANP
jgi:hypothetical protein